MQDFTVRLEEKLVPEDAEFLERKLNQYNLATTGIKYDGDLAVFVRDENGTIVAGLVGFSWGDYSEIKYLWVREDLRQHGFGSRLLTLAEEELRRRGSRLIILDTYSFQAPNFYPKFGFEAYAILENCPTEGINRYFYKKILDGAK